MTETKPLTVDSVPELRLEIRIRNMGGVLRIGRMGVGTELSDSAAYIWRQIDGERRIGVIAERLAGHYDLDVATAEADVLELIDSLVGADLVTIVQPDATGNPSGGAVP